MLEKKTTSNGRQPKNIKSWNEDDDQQPSMEDDLKILKVEYLSNHWSDFPQIWNLSLGDQTKI